MGLAFIFELQRLRNYYYVFDYNQFDLQEMGGKKWCEYCRINLPYNKKDIQEHQETRNHLQNKAKAIKFQRIKIQQEEKKQRQLNKQNALLSSANIPKAKKGSALQQQVQDYRSGVIASGKAAIHQLIAERTQGQFGAPIEFPEKEDLLLAENFITKKEKNEESDAQSQNSDSEEFEMWRIDICEQTGDPCFINNLTQVKKYEPPIGYIMSEKQKQQWEQLKQICKEKVDVNGDNTVNISEWQQVPDEEDYFKVNQVIQQDQGEEEKQDREHSLKRPLSSLYPDSNRNQKPKEQEEKVVHKSWKDQLEEKIMDNNIDANQVIGTVISHQLMLCKNLKQKNQTLKNLIKGDIQIRQTAEQFNKKEIFQDNVKKESIGFKPKKKLKTTKLTQEGDIY